MSWRTKLENRLLNDTIVNEAINEFTDYMNDAVNSFDVNINKSSSTIKMIIQNQSALDKASETMIGLTALNNVVVVGDIVTWNNEDWIVVSKDDKVIKNCNKVGIQKSNNILKFYNKISLSSGAFEWVEAQTPCIITTPFKTNLGLENDRYMTTSVTDYQIILSDNSETKIIDIGTRFFLNGRLFKCEGYDDLSSVGLKTIKVIKDLKTDDDNMELQIANYYSHQNTSTPIEPPNTVVLTINGLDYIKSGQQSTYTATITDNSGSVMRNVIWDIYADDGVSTTTLVSLVSVYGTYGENIVLKANSSSNYGYIKVRCHSTDGVSEQIKRIQIKSLL